MKNRRHILRVGDLSNYPYDFKVIGYPDGGEPPGIITEGSTEDIKSKIRQLDKEIIEINEKAKKDSSSNSLEYLYQLIFIKL